MKLVKKYFTKENSNIFLISFISLFLELLIIRLIGTEIRIFAYLSNLVLLAVFIGFGLGMFFRSKLPLITSAYGLFLIIVATSSNYIVRWPRLEFRFFPGVTELLSPLSESYIWLQPTTYSKLGIIIGLFLLIFLFMTIIVTFIPMGQILGRLLGNHKSPIQAYSINIAASFLGMWAFQLFSLLRFTPYFGILIMLIPLVLFIKNRQEKLLLFALIAITIVFIVPKTQSDTRVFWSPYQKLSLSFIEYTEGSQLPQPSGFYLEVNNVGYMSLLNLSKDYHNSVNQALLASANGINVDQFNFTDQYTLPFKFEPNAQNVLIIGAGG